MNSLLKGDVLARVEGHGSVELICNGDRVIDARLNLYESPRLFEALLLGRSFDEIPDIACRICSICSTIHKVAALQAVEQAMGIVVSPQTGLLRELAVQGGQIESHALHIFCLALPDYLGVNSIQELAVCEAEKLQLGLSIKKIGNMIQEIVGGRAIHPFNLLVGGVGRVPGQEQLHRLNEQLSALYENVNSCIDYIGGLDNVLPVMDVISACAVNGGTMLFGDGLVTSTGINIQVSGASAWLNEQIEANSNARVSRFNDNEVFFVGPLARIMLSMPQKYECYFQDHSIRSSLKARIVELKTAFERAQHLIGILLTNGLKKESPKIVTQSKSESGVSLIEAPRGVLIHSYRFDEQGICVGADIITPTAINQGAVLLSLKNLVAVMDGAGYKQVKHAAEILIRSYDPCISCAVH